MGGSDIRAWRQALLWLLRSFYVVRLAICYFVMIRGHHAEPDLIHAAFTTALFVDLLVFLVAFFSYEPVGRRIVIVESLLRPCLGLALVLGGIAWTSQPASSLGWARGVWGPLLFAAEYGVFPLLTLRLVKAVGGGRRPG